MNIKDNQQDLIEFKERYLLVECNSFYLGKKTPYTKGKILRKYLSEEFFEYTHKLCRNICYKGHGYLIIDIKDEKIIASIDGTITSSMSIFKDGIDIIEEEFEKYTSPNKNMVYNQTLINNTYLKAVEYVYSIGGVWIAIKYNTKNNTKRYLINRNIFENEHYFNSRHYKIKKLIS